MRDKEQGTRNEEQGARKEVQLLYILPFIFPSPLSSILYL